MTIALASTHHDPQGLLNPQAARLLPHLRNLYIHIAVTVTATTHPDTYALLHAHHVTVIDKVDAGPDAHRLLGIWRRRASMAALQANAITHVHLCDFDRVLHWAEYHPDELRRTLTQLPQYDFTVLGRTPRAFASHPRVQRDTETIINQAFALVFKQRWDVTAASRGLSRRAIEALVAGCDDDTIGNDCSWPLYLSRVDGLRLGYLETEGLEFETLDRFTPDIAATWIERMDNSPEEWARRLALAQVEVESVVAYRGTQLDL
jgi:hypothetical protein